MSQFGGAFNSSGNGRFSGLGMNLGNLSRLSQAKTRSISPENFDGAKGGGARATEGTGANCARDLGKGWKLSPSVVIKPGETFPVADITGSGAIQQIWMTPAGDWRHVPWEIFLPAGGVPGRSYPPWPSVAIPAVPSTAIGKCPFASNAASP